MGPVTALDAVESKRTLCSCWSSNRVSSVVRLNVVTIVTELSVVLRQHEAGILPAVLCSYEISPVTQRGTQTLQESANTVMTCSDANMDAVTQL